jgi:hypothetical protein
MNPKTFISYSWTSPEHEAWVLRLATELREVGVDVILDKWDLKEGHDAIVFMEQMVTNPDIKKVILVCDRKYTEKTDGRAGGVGTEAQIISPAVYSKSDQDKFVAVTTEIGADGKPFLPTYYKGRIYIDLSGDVVYRQNFEQLVRWTYDKPVHVKPALGKAPLFLSETEGSGLANAALQRRAIDAVKNAKPFAAGAISEYLDSVVFGLEAFRISGSEQDFDDKVIQSLERFLQHRAELIELFVALAQYRDNQETRRQVHRFFEQLLPLLDVPENVNQYNEWDFDNYKFIIHELFIYLMAILMKYEAFDFAAQLLRQPYYRTRGRRGGNTTESFQEFRQYMSSLEHRNSRLKTNRLSLRADLLEQRSHASGVSFQHVMQADFVLFLRGSVDTLRASGSQWWPETLLYSREHHGPFEIFARSKSKSYFAQISGMLDVSTKEDLGVVLEAMQTKALPTPSWNYHHRFSASRMMNFEQIATAP